MAKEAKAPAEPTEFPVTMEEFLTGISSAQVETKAGFQYLCKTEGITGKKEKAEWKQLFDSYLTKPTNKTWASHYNEGRK